MTADPKPQCPSGQYTAPTDLYVVNFGDGPLFWTIERINEFGGNLPWSTPIWEQLDSCYKPKEREPVDIDVLTPTIDALKTAANAVVTAYKATDRFLYEALCENPLVSAVAAYMAADTKVIEELARKLNTTPDKLVARASIAVAGACVITKTTCGSGSCDPVRQSDSDSDSNSDSVPGPASGLSLSAGDGQVAVSWSASAGTPSDGFGYWVQWKTASQTWEQSTAADQFGYLEHGDNLATSHTITGLVNGSAYGVRVAAFNVHGFSSWITDTDTPTAKPNSAATGAPVVSGTVRVGETLTAGTSGIADADGLGVFSYQWSADSSAISGATSAAYTLVAADEGKAISVAVSFTDGAGNAESVTSSPTAAVAAAEDSDDEDSDDEDSDDEDSDDEDSDDEDSDDEDSDDEDSDDGESRAEKVERLASLRAQWEALLPKAVRDDVKCRGICWDDPANAELLRVYNAWLALLRELYG